MARPGTETRARAREAFIELSRQGQRPTVAKLREVIGGGGTELLNSVIQEMENEQRRRAFDMPALPDDVTDIMLKLWDAANKRADERYQDARRECDQRIQTAEESRASALARSEVQEKRIGLLEEQLAVRTGEASALRTSLDAAEGRITGLSKSLREREEDVDRVRNDAAARIGQAETRAAAQVKLAEERYQGLERQLINNFDRDRTRLTQELERVTKDLAASESHIHQLHSDLDQVRDELSEHKRKLTAVEAERDRLKRNADKPWKRRGKQREA